MAEETVNTQVTETDDSQEVETQETETQENKPSVDELAAQLAALQNKYNKASKEAADAKKALRARQTAEEREAEEKAEAQRLADEERENMRKELNHIKAVAAYKNIPEEKTVEMLIEAVSESDHSAIATIIENEKQKAVKAAKAEWQKSRPQANIGSGEEPTVTKEQFDKMGYAKRVEFKNAHPELYKQYSEK